MFAEFMEQYGLSLIGAILTAILGFLGIVAKNMAQKWLDTKEKKQIAEQVVLFVEQVYKALGGQEKLKIALDAAREMLAERGIVYSELEMRVMIESVLARYNGVFWGGHKDKEDIEKAQEEAKMIVDSIE